MSVFEVFLNATSVATLGYSAISLPSVLLCVIVGAFLISLTSLRVFQRVRVFLAFMGKTFFHFIEGLGICLTGYSIYVSGLWLESLYSEGLFKPIWIIYGIGGFLVVSGIGWVGDKLARRIHANIKKKVRW